MKKTIDITEDISCSANLESPAKRIFHGVDVKRFQYEEYIETTSNKKIDIKDLIQKYLFNNCNIAMNCIMINLEKDTQRYNNTIEEFKKINIDNFAHLKGTYWKEKNKTCEDLTFVLNFLKDFNPIIESKEIKMDEFSFLNDDKVHIQDGPLACYISHLRSMIYGYNNFKDYTIICEDDISIANTETIEEYIQKVPDDWDILTMNACSKNKIYDSVLYKFDEDFHSTHFYIIKNKALPSIFKGMYPITDQVDVLLSNLRNQLNIYNIQGTVYQKNISTNTQNNLYVIFNSPHYDGVRDIIVTIEDSLLNLTNIMLENNEDRNKIISQNLLYDVFWHYILHFNPYDNPTVNDNVESYSIDLEAYSDYPDFDRLMNGMRFVLQCSKKGIKDETEARYLIKALLWTLEKFNLHDKDIKAYSFGTTAHTYICGEDIIKQYNDKLRWITHNHDNSKDIFKKELEILKRIQFHDLNIKLISCDEDKMNLVMNYCGESLWDNFKLPVDWKQQIKDIFTKLNSCGIFYPEFKLQNILVKDNKITFIDYGLAIFDHKDNSNNLDKFIYNLDKLNNKLNGVEIRSDRLQLITTFLNNQELIDV